MVTLSGGLGSSPAIGSGPVGSLGGPGLATGSMKISTSSELDSPAKTYSSLDEIARARATAMSYVEHGFDEKAFLEALNNNQKKRVVAIISGELARQDKKSEQI